MRQLTREECFDKFRDILLENLGGDSEEISDKTTFADDLACDSLDSIEIVMAAEETFDIEIMDEDCGQLMTVKDAVDYIYSRNPVTP